MLLPHPLLPRQPFQAVYEARSITRAINPGLKYPSTGLNEKPKMML